MHGEDPYDATGTLRLERLAGRSTDQPEITFSPPVIFFLVAPLGLLGAKIGAVFWTILLVATLVTSIHLLWIMHGRASGELHLLCYCFAPPLICLMAGQIGIFLLLGIVLFLFLHKNWPFFAGTVLVICIVKPHLFLLFGTVLLLWMINKRQYRFLAGFGIGLFAACTFAIYLDPHAWSQYARMMAAERPTGGFVPTLSGTLRLFVDRDAVWLQFLPVAIGCCWSIWYFWSRRIRWNWSEQGLLLLAVSVVCAPYAWITDESVLLPVILAALYRAKNSGRSLLPFGIITAVALAEILRGIWIITPYFVWTGPAWLAWYFYATSNQQADSSVEIQ